MNSFIICYNTLTYGLSALILLSAIDRGSKRKFVIAFFIIIAAGLLLAATRPNLIMPVDTALLTLCFSNGRQGLRRAFYISLTTIFLLWAVIVTASGIVMIIAPGWHNSLGFNLLIGGILVIAAMTARFLHKPVNWLTGWKAECAAILLELVILVFFSFILPLFHQSIAAERVRMWAVIQLTLMTILAIVGFLLVGMRDMAGRERALIEKVRRDREFAGQVQTQYEKIVTLGHY